MKIQVTAEDIRDGIIRDACNCPTALAIKRAFPGEEVHVRRSTIAVSGHDACFMPPSVKQFIEKFDWRDGVGCEPFEFDLDIQ